jgi:ribosomal protein S18 acetylase RimI-like enzyme
VSLLIRPLRDSDIEYLVGLSWSAWEPIFSSFEGILGPGIFPLLYPDWRQGQREGVEKICRDREKSAVWVAELAGRVVGFVAYEFHDQDKTGEVQLLAVHPDYQNRGIGTELNVFALDRMRESGMRLAVVSTGGDPSHAPARRSYGKAGYTALPLVRYYKDL